MVDCICIVDDKFDLITKESERIANIHLEKFKSNLKGLNEKQSIDLISNQYKALNELYSIDFDASKYQINGFDCGSIKIIDTYFKHWDICALIEAYRQSLSKFKHLFKDKSQPCKQRCSFYVNKLHTIKYYSYYLFFEKFKVEYSNVLEIENSVIDTISNKTQQEKTREIFIDNLKKKCNLNQLLNNHNQYREQIINDIINKEIPYIFALFEYFKYRDKMLEYFDNKDELYSFLTLYLNSNKNKPDIQKYWNCLDENSKLREPEYPKYNSHLYLKDIERNFPKT